MSITFSKGKGCIIAVILVMLINILFSIYRKDEAKHLQQIALQNTINDLNRYAAGLVASTRNSIFNPIVKEESDEYLIQFQTSDPNLLKENPDKDPEAYDRNIVRGLAWQSKFCTPELKAILTKHNINSINGHVRDSKLKELQEFASCSSYSAPTLEEHLRGIQQSLEGLESLRR